jgi:branched-chain amino acid transport system ATP-binding protein
MDEPTAVPPVELEAAEDRDYTGPLLAARNVVAGYVAGVDILTGCELELFKGELVGIIGPNGAGKSTLLKAMFGLVPIRSGSVMLRDQDITEAKAHLLVTLGVGYVPQNNNVFPSLTVQENLQMGLYQRPHDFGPRFEEVFIRCRQINETGVSIVMVEQNARRCLQICHRAFVLDQGRNAYSGTGDELMNDPKVIELYLGTLARVT